MAQAAYNAIIVTPQKVNGEYVRTEEIRDDDIKALLDGAWLQGIPFMDGTIAYIDDDGKSKGLPVNYVATMLCNRIGTPLHTEDCIVGTMIIVGTLNANGEMTGESFSVPSTILNAVGKAMA